MKKVLIILALVFMSVTNVSASRGYALKHANPLPNLMRIAMGNAEILQISKKQMNALMAWGKVNRPKMMMMAKEVINQEKMLHDEALGTDVDIVNKSAKMLSLRKKIIAMKTKCRKTLKSILSAKQYAQVITMYKSIH